MSGDAGRHAHVRLWAVPGPALLWKKKRASQRFIGTGTLVNLGRVTSACNDTPSNLDFPLPAGHGSGVVFFNIGKSPQLSLSSSMIHPIPMGNGLGYWYFRSSDSPPQNAELTVENWLFCKDTRPGLSRRPLQQFASPGGLSTPAFSSATSAHISLRCQNAETGVVSGFPGRQHQPGGTTPLLSLARDPSAYLEDWTHLRSAAKLEPQKA